MTEEKLTPAEEGEKAAAKEAAEKTLAADERREGLLKAVEKMLDLMDKNPQIYGSYGLNIDRHVHGDKELRARIRFYNFETEKGANSPEKGVDSEIGPGLIDQAKEVFIRANLNL